MSVTHDTGDNLMYRTSMRFDIGPCRYRVAICPGPLYVEGHRSDAMTHRHTILVCGVLPPEERIEALMDQLRRLYEKHHGNIPPDGLPSFIVNVMRQLLSQGGESAVRRLVAEPVVDQAVEQRDAA